MPTSRICCRSTSPPKTARQLNAPADLPIPRELKPICIPTFARYFKRLPTTCAEMRAYDRSTDYRRKKYGSRVRRSVRSGQIQARPGSSAKAALKLSTILRASGSLPWMILCIDTLPSREHCSHVSVSSFRADASYGGSRCSDPQSTAALPVSVVKSDRQLSTPCTNPLRGRVAWVTVVR